MNLPITRFPGAIKLLAGGDYSRDDFSKPAQLFFWKASGLILR